ncbi:hypothetical protein AMTRI_Chr03g52900 [Amborella trichopoda]
MWVEIVCGLVVYRLFSRFLFKDDEFEPQTLFDSTFAIASRLEKLYGGKVYTGLRIPDAENGNFQEIDMVLVTKGEAMVIMVKDISGFVDTEPSGSWVCMSGSKQHVDRHLNPVEETRKQVSILESYLERRGVLLPEGYLNCRVLLPNPNCRVAYRLDVLPEVISYEKWLQLKPGSKFGFSNWMKDAFLGTKKDIQNGLDQKLHFVLGSAPMWDRLELNGSRQLLGKFEGFKGKQEDMQTLQIVKRSKVNRVLVMKSTMFGFLGRKLHVLYTFRDYRGESGSASEWKECTVKPNMEILFQPRDTKKTRKLRLASVVSLSLSA